MRRAAVLVTMTLCALPAAGLELRRATIWDLVLGAPVAAQPAPRAVPGVRLRIERRSAARAAHRLGRFQALPG